MSPTDRRVRTVDRAPVCSSLAAAPLHRQYWLQVAPSVDAYARINGPRFRSANELDGQDQRQGDRETDGHVTTRRVAL